MTDETEKRIKATLNDSDVSARPSLARRSFLLGTIGGTMALAGCVPAGTTVVRTGTGLTDSDTGAKADPAGDGRGVRRASGITDSDLGTFADPVGNGRGRRACTDADVSGYVDPVGRGRRC